MTPFLTDTHTRERECVCVLEKVREFESPLPHIHPVWQHFITAIPLTRKWGRTSVRFSQLYDAAMGQNISCLRHDATAQNSCCGGGSCVRRHRQPVCLRHNDSATRAIFFFTLLCSCTCSHEECRNLSDKWNSNEHRFLTGSSISISVVPSSEPMAASQKQKRPILTTNIVSFLSGSRLTCTCSFTTASVHTGVWLSVYSGCTFLTGPPTTQPPTTRTGRGLGSRFQPGIFCMSAVNNANVAFCEAQILPTNCC